MRTIVLFLTGCLCCAQSCSPNPNYLEGSISRRFDLGFDLIRVEKKEDIIAISYLDKIYYREIDYRSINTVAKVTIQLALEERIVNKWISITDQIELDRYVVVMVEPRLLEQDRRIFPVIIDAEIGFYRITEKSVFGKFKIGFEDGSTLRGGFDRPWEEMLF